ncbi:tetratricopeptide repeat domain protein [Synechococcus sp. PCC 7335]|uniref:aspartyl protease family protein n=1 Tax=Synechococcus sp. (strain ATCC 29403 / PCC 7335) TaxID=91464 RepID=UPI00017EBC7F|nr:aspartyl protease family protein [Synechococcus sp. PCC 7335]EDX85231.1 tetratricopeptide repeat domain protein [Synechococcus sp. PCC 7335]
MTFETAAEKFRRARSLIAVGQVFEALPLLDELVEMEPGWAQVYVQRARIRKRLGNREGAIADYARAIKLAPTAELYLARALVWLSLDQVEGVIADSRQAITLMPELAGGHRLLGKALGLLGDGESAISAYKQAARCYLNEKDKENAQQCIDAIKPLRDLPPFVPSPEPWPSSDSSKVENSHEEMSWPEQINTQQATESAQSMRQIKTQSEDGKSKGIIVPIKSFDRHLPVVEAMFDGIAKFDMVIDRNAPNSIITQRIAKQLGLKEVSYQYVYLADGTPMELSIARLRSVVIGSLIVTDVEVAILPKGGSANAPDNATVVLGKNCFTGYSVRISGNEITFIR